MKTARTPKVKPSYSIYSKPFFNKTVRSSSLSPSSETENAFFRPAIIQPKLSVGQPGDKYEKEADAMAEIVTQSLVTSKPSLQLQRNCDNCEEEGRLQKKELELTRTKKSNNPTIERSQTFSGNKLEGKLAKSKGRGTQLNSSIKNEMESAFTTDFSQVKIHTDSDAVQMNRDLNAKAFTNGTDIYFDQGQYQAGSKEGNRLLAHELTHVIQQSNNSSVGKVQRQSDITEAPEDLPCELVENPNLGPSFNGGPTAEILFFIEEAFVTRDSENMLETFVQEWKNEGGNGQVYIDAYASVDGSQSLNWSLSCERAREVESFLIGLGVDTDLITIFAHGASDAFSLEEHEPNRRAVVTADPGHADPVEKDTTIDPTWPNCCLCTANLDLELQFYRASLAYAQSEEEAWLHSLRKFGALKSDVYVKPDRDVFIASFMSSTVSSYQAGLLYDEYTPVRVDTVHARHQRAMSDHALVKARCNDCTGQNSDHCLQGNTLGKSKSTTSTEEEKNKK